MVDLVSKPPTNEQLEQFALAEGVRTLTEQTASAQSTKERTVALVGLTATAASFLVGAVLDAKPDKSDFWFYSGMVATSCTFIFLLWLAWQILKPTGPWTSSILPSKIVDNYAVPDGWRLLVDAYNSAILENNDKLKLLVERLRRAMLCAGLTVIFATALLWRFG